MHNLVYLIGRLSDNPKIEKEDGKDIFRGTLVVQRPYKDENGIYDNDFIDCVFTNAIATHTAEYCHKGDLMGIKGRVETKNIEVNGITIKVMEIIVEKVSFLASKNS